VATYFETGVGPVESLIWDLCGAGNRQKKKEVLKKHNLYLQRHFPTAIVYQALVTSPKKFGAAEIQVLDLKAFLTGNAQRWAGIKACREEIRVQCPQLDADVKQQKTLAEILTTYPEQLAFYLPPKVAAKMSFSQSSIYDTD
jgi:hypothetical protein